MIQVKHPVHRVLARVVDGFGELVYRAGLRAGLWAATKRDPRELDPKRILIIEEEPVGDVIMSTALYCGLRRRFPKAHVTVMTGSWAAGVLVNNPHVDDVLIHDCPWAFADPLFEGKSLLGHLRYLWRYPAFLRRLRAQCFDLAIDLRGDFRNILLLMALPGIDDRISFSRAGGDYLLTHALSHERDRHEVERNLDVLRALGGDACDAALEVFPGPVEKKKLEDILHDARDERLLCVIHPGSRLAVRIWPPERYAELATMLVRCFDADVVVTGAASEEGLCDEVLARMGAGRPRARSLAGRLTMLEMAALLKRADLVVCPDTSVMHLAAACGAPTVALFGPGDPAHTGPYGGTARVIARDCPCRPLQTSCRRATGAHSACMETIGTDEVCAAAEEILSARLQKR